MSPGSERDGGAHAVLKPRASRMPRRASWQASMRRIGQFQSALLLSALYLVCWVPAGLLTRLFADWLRWRAPDRSSWWPRDPRVNHPSHVNEPF